MNATPNGSSHERPHLQTAEGAIFWLKTGETSLGRDPSCDIQLPDPSVSKRHCSITCSEGGFSVSDLGSTNHTFVNQICLRQGQSCQLVHGDRVSLGRTTLTFFRSEREGAVGAGSGATRTRAADKQPSESTMVSFDVGAPLRIGAGHPPSEAAFRELRKANERLSIFYDFGRDVGNVFDIEQLLRKVAARIMKLIPADGGVVFLGCGDHLAPSICWTREGFQDLSMAAYSRTAVTKAIGEKRGLLIRDIASQPDLRAAHSVAGLRIQSTMIVPIVLESEVFGALSLSACGERADFGSDDFAMVSGLAGQLAVAIKNSHLALEIKQAAAEKDRFQRELEIAAHVQKSILPDAPPMLPGLDIAGVSVFAREVGGDFYDYIPLGRHSLGTTIADVSGKGLAAALLTLQSRNVIHAFARENRSPAEVLSKANSVIYQDYSRADMFLSAFYSTIDLESRNLRYASAGHNPPILLRADGTCSSLDSTGCLLGISPNLSIGEESIPIGKSDILALYTDGLSEARDHARCQFGCQRLAKKLADYRGLAAQEIAHRIVHDVASFAGHDQFDDATLVVIKVEPES